MERSGPAGWLWIKWASPQSYAFSIMLINEFSGYEYTCNAHELAKAQGVCPYTTGDEYLGDIYALKGHVNDIGPHFIGLAGWYVMYMAIGAVCLHLIKFTPNQLRRSVCRVFRRSRVAGAGGWGGTDNVTVRISLTTFPTVSHVRS